MSLSPVGKRDREWAPFADLEFFAPPDFSAMSMDELFSLKYIGYEKEVLAEIRSRGPGLFEGLDESDPIRLLVNVKKSWTSELGKSLPYISRRNAEWTKYNRLHPNTERELDRYGKLEWVGPNCLFMNPIVNLSIVNAKISMIVPDIYWSMNLAVLNLSKNKIRVIPPEIRHLANLIKLNLDYNQVRAIPPELAQLKGLQELSIRQNPIEDISREIWELHRNGTLCLWVDLPNSYLYETMNCAGAYDCRMTSDIVHLIMMRILPGELGNVSMVCKKWYQIATSKQLWQSYPIDKIFPKATIFGPQKWEELVDLDAYGLSFEGRGRPCLNSRREYVEIKSMASKVEWGAQISFLDLPKGLTWSKLVQIAIGLSKNGFPINETITANKEIRQRRPDLLETSLDETCTVAITNNIFLKSRGVVYKQRKEILEELNCEAPTIMAIMALTILRIFINAPKGAPSEIRECKWYRLCYPDEFVEDVICKESFSEDHYIRFLVNLDSDDSILDHFPNVSREDEIDGAYGMRVLSNFK